jgi:DNA polymerase elongation subunit (family B)
MQSFEDLLGVVGIPLDDVAAIRAFMTEHGLVIRDGKVVPQDAEAVKKLKALSQFWNQRQQARKILLNSLYGALLNEGLRFYDERLGQSVTLTGRSIVRHMNAKANEFITGKYDYTGNAIVYADTDSCYFSGLPLKDNPEWRDVLLGALAEMEEANEKIKPEDHIYRRFDFDNRTHMVRLYDDVSDLVNDTFPEFMAQTFNTSLERGGIIKAGRELVASTGLFIKKKKYAVLMYDKEGTRYDIPAEGSNEVPPGKLKAMGLDLKRADTPKFMQQFLTKCLMDLLTGESKTAIFDSVRDFRNAFKDRPAQEKGSPKKVSGLTSYGSKANATVVNSIFDDVTEKVRIPGHVQASMNWNRMCEVNDDKYSQRITDGTRIVVCKLKKNPMRMDTIAYPIDEPHLPEWFLNLPFDHEAMEETIIDNKLDNLLGVMDWNLQDTKTRWGDDLFDFSVKKKKK